MKTSSILLTLVIAFSAITAASGMVVIKATSSTPKMTDDNHQLRLDSKDVSSAKSQSIVLHATSEVPRNARQSDPFGVLRVMQASVGLPTASEGKADR